MGVDSQGSLRACVDRVKNTHLRTSAETANALPKITESESRRLSQVDLADLCGAAGSVPSTTAKRSRRKPEMPMLQMFSNSYVDFSD